MVRSELEATKIELQVKTLAAIEKLTDKTSAADSYSEVLSCCRDLLMQFMPKICSALMKC